MCFLCNGDVLSTPHCPIKPLRGHKDHEEHGHLPKGYGAGFITLKDGGFFILTLTFPKCCTPEISEMEFDGQLAKYCVYKTHWHFYLFLQDHGHAEQKSRPTGSSARAVLLGHSE